MMNHTLGAIFMATLFMGSFLVIDIGDAAAVSAVPGVPTGLSALPVGGQVVINWIAPSDGGSPITHYDLYRSTSLSGTYELVAYPLGSNYTDAGLSAGQIYWYKVSAVNGVGEGAQSNAVSVLAPQPVSPSNEGAMMIILIIIASVAAIIAVLFILRERRMNR